MMRHRLYVSLTVVLVLAACGDDPVAPSRASLTTDARTYVATPGAPVGTGREYSLTIVATFTNTTSHTVILGRCTGNVSYPIYGIDFVNATGEAAYSPGWDCVGGHGFRVSPAATRVDTLPIRGPWGVDHFTGVPHGAFDGRFQLVYEMYFCRDETPACSDPVQATARSNVFAIVRGS